MLIHEQDFLVIDLQKSQDNYYHTYKYDKGDLAGSESIKGEGFRLVFTLQVNGKLKRSELLFEVMKTTDYVKLNPPKSYEPTPDYNSEYVIYNYSPIYSCLELLHNIGYKLKENEFDGSYSSIINKIKEEVNYYFETQNNYNTVENLHAVL